MRRVRGGYMVTREYIVPQFLYMVNLEACKCILPHFFVVFRAKKYFQRLLTWPGPQRQPDSTPDDRGGYRAAREPVT